MIEMHSADDELAQGSSDGIYVPVGPTRVSLVGRLIGGPSALGLTALILAVASITLMQPVDDIGEVRATTLRHANALSSLRAISAVRLGIAVIALVIAVIAAVRHFGPRPAVWVDDAASDANDDFEARAEQAVRDATVEHPDWMRMIIGAALMIAVLSVVLNAVAFSYAVHEHAPRIPGLFYTGGD